jgi:hypothetical protein
MGPGRTSKGQEGCRLQVSLQTEKKMLMIKLRGIKQDW